MTTRPKRLSPEELQAAREKLAAQSEKDNAALTDQIVFEAQRDELAYKLIRDARAETPRRHLSLGDAQQLAAERLQAARTALAEPGAPVLDVAPQIVVADSTPTDVPPPVIDVAAESVPDAPAGAPAAEAAPDGRRRKK